MHESNTFNPIKADRAAFQAQSLIFGPGLLDEWQKAHHEVGGFIEQVTSQGNELLPLVMAWAMPSGPVTDDVFNEIIGHIIRECQEQSPTACSFPCTALW